MNPTIGIHDTSWDAINHTINWISNVLSWGYKEWGGYKDENRSFVMQSEHIVIDPNMVELEKIFQTTKEAKHGDVNKLEVGVTRQNSTHKKSVESY